MTCPDEYQLFNPTPCDPYDDVPDNETLCASCEGRCGDSSHDYTTFEWKWDGGVRTSEGRGYRQCGCHTDCRRSNECCKDFQVTCPDEYQLFVPRLCDPDDDVPDNETLCTSCQGRCGVPGISSYQCNCNTGCRSSEGCCEDFQMSCPDEYKQFDSCHNRCGERRSFPDQCDCHSECRGSNTCCENFQLTCLDEYRQFESCHGRCGDIGVNHQCKCYSDCRRRNECCGDFQAMCLEEHQEFIPELCDSDDDVPDNQTLCRSCQGRCGDIGTNRHQCNCHTDCRGFAGCCEDFEAICPDDFRQFIPELCYPRDDVPDNKTTCKSCQDRCGQWGNSSYQCACHGECIHFYDSCCDDFQTQCRNEYQEYQSLEDRVCEPDVQIPEDMVQCGICEKRCGSKSVVAQMKYECNCDVHCRYYGDCCQDFQTSCSEENEQFQQLFEMYPFNRTFQDFQCLDKYFHTFIMSTCPDGTECEFTPELSEDGNNSAPVYDVHRGVHYISGYCAMCNGATEVTPWEVKLNCDVAPEPKDNSGMVNSTDSPSDMRNSRACAVTYKPSGDLRPCDYSYWLNSRIIISTCSASCPNQYLITLCDSDFVSMTFDKYHTTLYKNGYCAMCNNETTWHCLGDPILIDVPQISGQQHDVDVPNFALSEVVYVGRLPLGVRVRPKSCPTGLVLEVSDCIPEASNITVIVNGTLYSELSSQLITVLRQNIGKLEGKIRENVVKVIATFGVSHRNIQIFSSLELEKLTIINTNNIQCNCNYSSLFKTNDSTTSERFQTEILSKVRMEIILFLELRNIHVESVESEIEFEINNVTFLQHDISDCTWLVYQRNETSIENKSVTIDSSGKTYTSGRFEDLGDTVLVCETNLNVPDEEIDDRDIALGILSLICYVISIICLIIRLILQPIIIVFQKRQGKLHLQLTIALLVTFLMLIIGVFLSDDSDACIAGAVLLAYGFLAAFIWMNIIAVDTWLAFRPSAAFSRADEDERSLIVHYLCGWGIPLLLVAVSLGMNFADVDEKFRPEEDPDAGTDRDMPC